MILSGKARIMKIDQVRIINCLSFLFFFFLGLLLEMRLAIYLFIYLLILLPDKNYMQFFLRCFKLPLSNMVTYHEFFSWILF